MNLNKANRLLHYRPLIVINLFETITQITYITLNEHTWYDTCFVKHKHLDMRS